MKAWLLKSMSGLSALEPAEVPDPTPGAGEVVVEVAFASLNPADRYLAEGQYPAKPPFPHVLGRDGVGTVVAVGPGVTGVAVGDTKVILRGEAGVSRWGTLAERVAVPADVLVDVPAGWSAEQAAGAPLVYLTAYQAITQWTDLPKSGVVLITGASGGVGLAAVQLAAAMGYTPVGLSRDAEKGKAIVKHGAKLVLSPADPKWREQMYAAVGRRPTVLAIDNVGGAGLPEVIDTMTQDGRISVVGMLAGPVPGFSTASLFFRRLRVGGVAAGTYTAATARSAWGEIVRLMVAGGHAPVVDRVFEFGQVHDAFARLAAGPLGKVLVRVG